MVLSSVTSTLMASRLRLVGPTSEKQRWLWFEGMKALREENKFTVDDVECLRWKEASDISILINALTIKMLKNP